EHTELALQQAPGVLAVLDDVESHAQQLGLGSLMRPDLDAARAAVAGYQAHLNKLLPTAKRPWRLGAALYETKFAHDIQ
ncbi:hypothetical protein, partial [Klebsiella pneumoniae]|uniref:hypothetical protein n=1 Tax=Klebsiella pneumoniae TaxID=573 RepID=UPI001954F9A2